MARTHLHLSVIALSVGLALSAQAQAQDASSLKTRRDAAISRLTANTGGQAQVSLHSATGAARFVRLAPGARPMAQALARGASSARSAGPADEAKRKGSAQFLADYGNLFGITDAASELDAGRMSKDRHGGTHFTHRQLYQGVPVFGGELKTHFDAADNLTVVNGTFVPDIALKTKPTRSADQAIAVAMARAKANAALKKLLVGKLSAATPTLLVYRAGLAQGVAGANHLAWQVEVGNGVNVREFVFVDAHTGKVIDSINGIHDTKNRRAFDSLGATAPGPNYPASPFWVEGEPFPTGTIEADNMIAASGEIYDLFKNAFGRDSFNGNGATMDSVFNRGNGCPNASWNGTLISFCPGTTTDDVTAHEWAHAYTEYTHGLIYAWQPGALNESYSDIWGETVDRLNGRGGDTPDAARSAGSCTTATALPPSVVIASPPAIAGPKSAGGASFGPQSFSINTTNVVLIDDGADTATDGCTGPFTNAAAVSGKIALIDRGNCAFALKTKNAQDNGAIGVIIADNSGGNAVSGMSGSDPAITIPALRISQNNGAAIKTQLALGAVTASMASAGVGSDSSVRWLIGEDSSAFSGAIRDMYNPTCYGDPGKVSDEQYACGPNTQAGDNGGVHINSGVPNHAYALLVDGGSYNGQTIAAIGLTKAAHIYYRAQSVYQGQASGFVDHADALQQSCTDLTGVNLNHLKTGALSGEVINATDCAQIANVALAVELRTPPTQCNFQPILAKTPPALCEAGSPTVLASDKFDGGKRTGLRWIVTSGGTGDFAVRNWGVVKNLPDGRAGYAIFGANDPSLGTCNTGSDATSLKRLESPEITIPAGTPVARFSFDHWLATESGWDGGNVKISVNGGAWQLVQAADFAYNPYNTTLETGAAGNSNPLAGQPAFTGTDDGSVTGSWGRSIINLAAYAVAGDKIKLRFELGQDGCGGNVGWYVDDVTVYRCSAPAP